MTASEHLQKIKAKCQELLAIAERRTAGRWQQGNSSQEMNMDMVYRKPNEDGQSAGIPTFGRNSGLSREQDQHDAAYIASCAGPAEAGWRATIAAIDDWLNFYVYTDGFADGAPDASPHDKLCNEIAHMCRANLNRIIAAWPEELL